MCRNPAFLLSATMVLSVANGFFIESGKADQQNPPAQVNPPATQNKGAPPAQGNPGQVNAGQINPGQQNFNYGRVQAVPWFNEPGARKQLNLTDAQVTKLNQGYTGYWNQYKNAYDNLGKLNENQRTEKAGETWSNFNNQMMKTAEGTLSPQQYDRYRQLHYQYSGLGMAIDPTIQQKLDLTPAQQQQLRDYTSKQAQQMDALYKNYGANAKGAHAQYDDLRRQNAIFFNNLLTEQQRQEWRGLTGESYAFPAEWYFKPQ